MTWMQRLKRVFNMDIEVCEHCSGHVRVIASIEESEVIEQFLKHRKHKMTKADAARLHELPLGRALPLAPSLFDPSQIRLFN